MCALLGPLLRYINHPSETLVDANPSEAGFAPSTRTVYFK
jgi:hypothetical protein